MKILIKKHQKGDWNELQEDILFMGVPQTVRDEINKDPDGYQPKPPLTKSI